MPEQLTLFNYKPVVDSPSKNSGLDKLLLALEHNLDSPTRVLCALHELGAQRLGRGADRICYGIGQFAVKVQKKFNYGNQNLAESINANKYKLYCPKVYKLLTNTCAGVSVLVCERVKQVPIKEFREMLSTRPRFAKRYDKIMKTFSDTHYGNIGIRRGLPVMLDVGYEAYLGG